MIAICHSVGLAALSYSIRHQIFVSSTFTDLKDERAEVIQAIWEMDCIPTGMEAFVASNESQWDVIKRVIDECDYYVLIIGGRYGSLAAEGISYTEKEYRYAKSVGLPVLAFVHAAPDQIALGRSEQDEALRGKLLSFRGEILKNYPVREWKTAAELGAVVSRSLIREMRINPRPGWVRNDGSSPIALLEQVNRLTEENRTLRETSSSIFLAIDETLASGGDVLRIQGERMMLTDKTSKKNNELWNSSATYDDVFRDLGPALINEASEGDLKDILARYHSWSPTPNGKTVLLTPRPFVYHESWSEVLIQFRALGFIVPGTKKRAVSDTKSYWKLTPKGDAYLLALLAKRRNSSDKSSEEYT